MDITVGKTVSWVFGALFILGGLGSLTQSIAGGLIITLTGIFLIPNVRQAIDDRFDIGFSRWMVVLIVLIGLGISGALMPNSYGDTNASSDTETLTDANPSSNQSGQSKNSLVEKSATELVVRGDDLPTEWTYNDVKRMDSNTATREAKKVNRYGGSFINNTVTVFDSVEEAKKAYNNKVQPIKTDRGYEKLENPFGKSEFGDQSFAYKETTGYFAHLYFYQDNVFVKLDLTSSSSFTTETGKLFDIAEAIEKRINK